ncbi:MAG: cation:proton antiporter [Candidatus Omnitrophica bacterium]|nr:cation:proton antiporter [Candidatus Omnitrophota bacterium]
MAHFNINILLLLGLAIFGGMVGGRLFQKLKIPQVVGYIIIGIIIGESGFKIVDDSIIMALRPFNYFALGLIGFMVGGELKKEAFSKYGKNFLSILICEGLGPFILVSLFISLAGIFFLKSVPAAIALALLLGAIASATDPASTVSVLKEYKTRGPLTTNIIGIVALDDGLALLLFSIAASVASALMGRGGEGYMGALFTPFYEIAGAIFIGGISGLGLSKIIQKYDEKERILAFSIGTVLLVVGLALATGVSMILATMTLGIVMVNIRPHKSKEAFRLVDGFTPPIYVLFFVLVGAQLHLRYMTPIVIGLAVIYIVFTIVGKMAGAYIGGWISRSPKSVTRYLPFALFSQAGIAIGLSILAAQYFPGPLGTTLIVIITATTFVTQLIGPAFVKFAVTKAQEVGLNITEEDIIKESRVKDVMDKNPPLIYANMKLSDILRIFSEDDRLYYTVINKDKKLEGIITIEGIKNTFLETDSGGLILAHDLMEPASGSVTENLPLAEATDALNHYDTDYMPVVDPSGRVEGAIYKRQINKFISTKIIELREKVEFLDAQ